MLDARRGGRRKGKTAQSQCGWQGKKREGEDGVNAAVRTKQGTIRVALKGTKRGRARGEKEAPEEGKGRLGTLGRGEEIKKRSEKDHDSCRQARVGENETLYHEGGGTRVRGDFRERNGEGYVAIMKLPSCEI